MRSALILTASVLGLSLTGLSPAMAVTQTVTPSAGTNDGTKSFVLSGPTAVADEQVTLKLAGHPDISGTVTEPDAGPLCIKGVSDSGCGTSITVSVPLLNAFPGAYDIVRTSTPASLGSTPTTTTAAAAYTVKSQPVVSSISPSTRGQGSSSLVTITGTGFAPGPAVSFGDGIVVSDVAYVSATSITANVAVPSDAALGARDLTVTSADGLAGSKTGALTVAPKPTLTALSVTSAKRSESFPGVVFTGSNFATGGDFAITINGVDVVNPVVSDGGTKITADLTVHPDAVGGSRTVFLTNADGGPTQLLNGFTILTPPGAPQAVAAYPGDTLAVVAWTAPTDPGTSPVSKWVVTPSDPAVAPVTVAGTATSAVVHGLTNGTSYTFDVLAGNAVGDGPKKTTSAVVPKLAARVTAVSSKSVATSGESTVVSGYLRRATGTPLPGRPVSLRITPQVGAASVRALTTDANGHWTTTVPLTYTTTFVASYAGTSDTTAHTAPSVVVPVRTRITVASPASGAYVGSPFAVRGRVSPNKAGKSVGVYRSVNGSWTLVGTGTIRSDGTFVATARAPYGDWVLKVTLGPTVGNASGTSPLFVIRRR